ncbi:MAG: hypothetical protein EXX96DRAFT_535352 [Benjaminiella poitrasii]|nr:MAG: hypothetical protein EXX96DRAFT_535352 [Benjaminiella poitrasii]
MICHILSVKNRQEDMILFLICFIEYLTLKGMILNVFFSMKANRSINALESSIPSPRTTKMDQFSNYITYLLQHINLFFFLFYNFDRFYLYQGRQRATDNTINVIIDCSSIYNITFSVEQGKKKRSRRMNTARRTILKDNTLQGAHGQSLLDCKSCKIFWQRDVNASKNTMSISISIWKDEGRQAVFCRSS